uniref:beta-N-acetylhexosaminidase n=1 Tax=Eutreptiella gymnastica TaxID=73025 RepID=A0A7S1JHB4_9EUGL|mmetsp:Transcript_982/g.2037  ORF Transcript_982/g.2037 Transcript_982/m.2037 type:complete len:691 (+) Transcript_982:185-2257(+)
MSRRSRQRGACCLLAMLLAAVVRLLWSMVHLNMHPLSPRCPSNPALHATDPRCAPQSAILPDLRPPGLLPRVQPPQLPSDEEDLRSLEAEVEKQWQALQGAQRTDVDEKTAPANTDSEPQAKGLRACHTQHVLSRPPGLQHEGVKCPPEASLCILPQPMEVHVLTGYFELLRTTAIMGIGKDVQPLVAELEHLLHCDLGVTCAANSSRPIRLHRAPHIPPEGYVLSVSPKYLGIQASTASGVFYAFQTLKQLLPVSVYAPASAGIGPWRVPAVRIRDEPRYKWRGLMFDSVRHFYSVRHIKHLLDLMALHKLNMFHWHLTDDQGWRIEINGHPELTAAGAMRGPSLNLRTTDGYKPIYNGTAYSSPQYYTQSQIQEVVQYAGELHIEIVPEIDVPAHAAALIIAARQGTPAVDLGIVELHEGCKPPGEGLRTAPNCMGGVHGIVVPTAEAIQYLKRVLQDVVRLFPGRYVHLGGDEAEQFRTAAYGTKLGQRAKSETKIWNDERLQGYLLDELSEFLSAQAKTGMAWDDSFVNLAGYEPKKGKTWLVWWRDWASEASFEKIMNLGHPVVLAPTSKAYLDVFQVEPHRDSEYQVQAGTVHLKNSWDIRKLAHSNIVGLQALLWTETIISWDIAEYQMFPRLVALADAAWVPTTTKADWGTFLVALKYHKKRLARRGVRYNDGSFTGEFWGH